MPGPTQGGTKIPQ